MNRFLAPAALALLILVGCDSTPNKVDVQKKVQESLKAASPEWTDVTYDTKANDTVSAVLAGRKVNGKDYEYSFTGGKGSGGVAVRAKGGDWLCKYRYEGGKEVDATKMKGTDADVQTFRPTAAEMAMAVLKAVP
jgi:hypothetical protein